MPPNKPDASCNNPAKNVKQIHKGGITLDLDGQVSPESSPTFGPILNRLRVYMAHGGVLPGHSLCKNYTVNVRIILQELHSFTFQVLSSRR